MVTTTNNLLVIEKEKSKNASKPSKFRVPIKMASQSKIAIIAAYKQKKIAEDLNQIALSENILTSSIKPKNVNASDENIKILESLQKSSTQIQKEMLALATIQTSLFWLLRKTTYRETMRNHSLN